MLEHFKDYNDIVGDHPQNLQADRRWPSTPTCSTHEPKYKDWLLEYVDAWRERMLDNDGIIPTQHRPRRQDRRRAGGKWYGGVYGWGFTVIVPQTGEKVATATRTTSASSASATPTCSPATTATSTPGGSRSTRSTRTEKMIDGRKTLPAHVRRQGLVRLHAREVHARRAGDLVLVDEATADRDRVPQRRLARRTSTARTRPIPSRPCAPIWTRSAARSQGMRADTTTPDTRLADDPMGSTRRPSATLVELMLGGIHPGHNGLVAALPAALLRPAAATAPACPRTWRPWSRS